MNHRLVSALIRWTTDSSANWFSDAHNHQRTNSRHHTTSSENWFPTPHNLVRKLIHWSTDLWPNWFTEAHTRQRTDLVMHIIISELIPDTTQPRQWTDSLLHTTLSGNLFAEAQICDQTDSLKLRLISELMRFSTDSSADWSAKHRLLSALLQGCKYSSVNCFPRPHYLVRELIPYSTQPCLGSESLKHRLVMDLML
jgi:hypothetical protein